MGSSIRAGESLTPLMGRESEVDLLMDRWELAQEGAGQVVQMVGEAGLGKSRLVHTLRQAVIEGGAEAPAIIEWRSSERAQGTGLRPIAECLARQLEFGPGETPAMRFDRLAQHLESRGLGQPETIALFAKLLFLPPDTRYPAPSLPPSREREAIFRAVHAWLLAATERGPVLFVVEDLHWIDASTLEFLEQFVAADVQAPILTLLTFRPEFRVPWAVAPHLTTVVLNRLTRRQVSELMQKSARGTLPTPLVTQIYQRTGGVPLLVEEFSRMACESGIFAAAPAEIPTTLQQLVMARLDRMSSHGEVVHLAATLGREFHYRLLAAVTSVDEPTLEAELAKLENAEIVFRKGQPPDCTYAFKHALLEEALRSAPDEACQRQFHRQVAETMEAQFPQSSETQPELLAQHFTAAGVVEKAVIYWLRAGLRSQERFANVEAIGHFTKGLELLRTQEESAARDARELRLLGPLGTTYIAARGYAAPEVGPIFQRARQLSQSHTRLPEAFVMLRGHFAFHIVRGDFRLCTDLAAEAMQMAERAEDPGLLMEALFLRGLTCFYRGDFAGAHESCARALAEYDDRARTAYWAAMTGENSGVTHRSYLALASWHLGTSQRALELDHEARELAQSLQHPFTVGYALHHSGWLHHSCRLGPQTQATGEEQIRIASEQGFLFWQATGTLYAAAGLLLRERIEEGLPRLQEGLAAYRATGAGLGLTYYLSLLGAAFTQAGRFDEARRYFDEAFALVEKNDEHFQEAELHRLRGELHLAESGDETAAIACFQRAIDLATSQQSRAWELRATTSLARLRHRQGRGHEARAVLTRICDRFAEGSETPDLADAAALLTELGNERMRDDIEAGIRYVRGCIPPPLHGRVEVDWRYVPSSTLGGDAIGYHWVDEEHLALYLIDVTGHGLDSALLSVTITNVLRSGTLAGADPRRPDQVLAALNEAFQGARHGYKFFTLWYGVYRTTDRELTYASGGHPSALALPPPGHPPAVFPATGPVLGALRGVQFPTQSTVLPAGTRLFIFSDGVFEIRRDGQARWTLPDCLAYLTAEPAPGVMDRLFDRVRDLRGSAQLDDDFSIIEARFP